MSIAVNASVPTDGLRAIRTALESLLTTNGIRVLPAGQYPKLELSVIQDGGSVRASTLERSETVRFTAVAASLQLHVLTPVAAAGTSATSVPAIVWQQSAIDIVNPDDVVSTINGFASTLGGQFALARIAGRPGASTAAAVVEPLPDSLGQITYGAVPESFVPQMLNDNGVPKAIRFRMPQKKLNGALIEARFVHAVEAHDWASDILGWSISGGGANERRGALLQMVLQSGGWPFIHCDYRSEQLRSDFVFWFQKEPDAAAIAAEDSLRGSSLIAQFGRAISSCPATLAEARIAAQR